MALLPALRSLSGTIIGAGASGLDVIAVRWRGSSLPTAAALVTASLRTDLRFISHVLAQLQRLRWQLA